MSRSFTSRPSVTSTRGRGTRQNTVNQRTPQAAMTTEPNYYGARPRDPMNVGARGMGPPDERDERNIQGQEAGRRLTHQGGYSVLPPDEQKRQKINQIAQRETEAYQAHKQQQKPKTVSYVGTAGGGQMTQQEARLKLAQNSPTKAQKLIQNQERKMTMRQREDAELQKKKEEQRNKATLNQQRQKQEAEASQHKWDNQRRRTNDAFLKRFEKVSTKPTGPVSQAASRHESHSQSADLSHDHVSHDEKSHDQNMAARPSQRLTPEQMKKVEAIAVIFPQYSYLELIEALRLADFSMDNAVAILE